MFSTNKSKSKRGNLNQFYDCEFWFSVFYPGKICSFGCLNPNIHQNCMLEVLYFSSKIIYLSARTPTHAVLSWGRRRHVREGNHCSPNCGWYGIGIYDIAVGRKRPEVLHYMYGCAGNLLVGDGRRRWTSFKQINITDTALEAVNVDGAYWLLLIDVQALISS